MERLPKDDRGTKRNREHNKYSGNVLGPGKPVVIAPSSDPPSQVEGNKQWDRVETVANVMYGIREKRDAATPENYHNLKDRSESQGGQSQPNGTNTLFIIYEGCIPNHVGLLVTVPVSRNDEVPATEIEPAIEQAVREAEARGLRSAQVTPFLLARIAELSGERSLHANLALLKNNARVAAEIAVAVAGSD